MKALKHFQYLKELQLQIWVLNLALQLLFSRLMKLQREFLKAQQREDVWTELSADADAVYDEELTINLSELEPLVCMSAFS